MKKVLFLLSFFFALGLASVNAQSCHGAAGKSCCADKAAKAAAADQTIEKRMNDDGTVAYVRKEADAQGNVKFVSVKFDEPSAAFVTVAPLTASTDATTTGTSHKACAMQGSGKACCAGKEGKACCAGKAKADADQK
jgi:hypothetical protein